MALIHLMILGLLHIDVEVVEDHFPIISDGFIAALSCIFSVPKSLLDTPQLLQLPYHFCSFFSLKTLEFLSREESHNKKSAILTFTTKPKWQLSKGQLISRGLFDVIVWTKKTTKFFYGLLS